MCYKLYWKYNLYTLVYINLIFRCHLTPFLASSFIVFLNILFLLYIIALIEIIWADTGATKNKNAIAKRSLNSKTCKYL